MQPTQEFIRAFLSIHSFQAVEKSSVLGLLLGEYFGEAHIDWVCDYSCAEASEQEQKVTNVDLRFDIVVVIIVKHVAYVIKCFHMALRPSLTHDVVDLRHCVLEFRLMVNLCRSIVPC